MTEQSATAQGIRFIIPEGYDSRPFIAALVLGDREGLDVVIRNPSRVVVRALQLTGCIDLFDIVRFE